MDNPYVSKDFIINTLSQDDIFSLKQSLLGQTIKVLVDPVYGLITEHGFPVAVATFGKVKDTDIKEFTAKVIAIEPMVTIYEIP